MQGSVLDPLRLLLQLSDKFEVILYGTPFLFADDTRIVYSKLAIVNEDFWSLENWCSKWLRKFPANKSSSMT